eukprot:TRINITY_DN48238_c0_g1_i1.p1 TRINITY_DN48238_c0_g1~~TRINITY_DN48238_c0_g1_i1.p1  ORF type:complete len:769 (+),score=118.14 TRINITY_DN48238_c0_g1_i1:221-2527(+)
MRQRQQGWETSQVAPSQQSQPWRNIASERCGFTGCAEWSQASQDDAAKAAPSPPTAPSPSNLHLDEMYHLLETQLATMNESVDKFKYRSAGLSDTGRAKGSPAVLARIDHLRKLLGPAPSDQGLASRVAAALTNAGTTVQEVLRALDSLERDLASPFRSTSKPYQEDLLRMVEGFESEVIAAQPSESAAVRSDVEPRSRFKGVVVGRRAASPSKQVMPRLVTAAASPRNPAHEPQQQENAISKHVAKALQASREELKSHEKKATDLSIALRNLGLRTFHWAASANLPTSSRCDLADLVLSCVRPVSKHQKELKNFCQETELDLLNLARQSGAVGGETAIDSGLCPGETQPTRRFASESDESAECVRLAKENENLRSIIAGLSSQAAQACKSIVVNVPDLDKPLSGVYQNLEGALPNGFPLWKQRDGIHWMYTGSKSCKWFIGSHHERDRGFKCDSGYVSSFEAHNGRLPVAMPAGGWQRLVEMTWVCDASISLTYNKEEKSEKEALESTIADKDRTIASLGRLITEQAFLPPGGVADTGAIDPEPEEFSVSADETIDGDLGWTPIGLPRKAHDLCTEPIFVGKVDEGSWASTVGLLIGDQLISINGKQVRGMEKHHVRNEISDRPLVCVFSREQPSPPSASAAHVAAAVAAAVQSHNVTGGGTVSPRTARRPPMRKLVPQERGAILFDAQHEGNSLGFTTVGMPPKPVFIHQIDQGASGEEMYTVGDELFMINNRRLAGMTNQQMMSALTERPLLLSFLRVGLSASKG